MALSLLPTKYNRYYRIYFPIIKEDLQKITHKIVPILSQIDIVKSEILWLLGPFAGPQTPCNGLSPFRLPSTCLPLPLSHFKLSPQGQRRIYLFAQGAEGLRAFLKYFILRERGYRAFLTCSTTPRIL